ncbi:hypothetical protein CVT26_009143 [Gymnopilus dilepis]|uniref:Uncharacterized protein n=1 Tax=Gymnopilus dilepis TaxID=231916 RepID=A0A409YRK8_9AGAR|nr:hypothetical protein CVT26_009143 [Gymnopilus dilepis]
MFYISEGRYSSIRSIVGEWVLIEAYGCLDETHEQVPLYFTFPITMPYDEDDTEHCTVVV